MRYVLSKFKMHEEDKIYRIYVTDSLKAIGNLDKRYADIIKTKPIKRETRTPSEIVEHIRRKLNGFV